MQGQRLVRQNDLLICVAASERSVLRSDAEAHLLQVAALRHLGDNPLCLRRGIAGVTRDVSTQSSDADGEVLAWNASNV